MPEEDLELKAMGSVASAMEGLDDATRQRVLRWAFDRFGAPIGAHSEAPERLANAEPGEAAHSQEPLPELFHRADPTTDVERALVVSYWLQAIRGSEDLQSEEINKELKNLGYSVRNITRAMEGLISRRPQLAIQTRKQGTTKQARKKYRLTEVGVRQVREMLKEKKSDQ